MTPQSLAAEVESLFALPGVVLRVNALLDSPEANARDISASVELGPGLAAGVLPFSASRMNLWRPFASTPWPRPSTS